MTTTMIPQPVYIARRPRSERPGFFILTLGVLLLVGGALQLGKVAVAHFHHESPKEQFVAEVKAELPQYAHRSSVEIAQVGRAACSVFASADSRAHAWVAIHSMADTQRLNVATVNTISLAALHSLCPTVNSSDVTP